MIRWGILMAGMLGFILVLALASAWAKRGNGHLPALFGALALGSLANGGCPWLTSLTAAQVEHAELESIASQNAEASRESEEFNPENN